MAAGAVPGPGLHRARRARLAETDRQSLRFLMHAGLSALLFGFLLRELDIDQFGTAPAWAQAEKPCAWWSC